MSKDVSFNIKLKIEGKDMVVEASTSAKELADQLGIVTERIGIAEKRLMRWSQGVMAIQSIQQTVKTLQQTIHNLTEESNRFNSSMRAANTMAGKDADGFELLKSQVAGLSKTIPMAREELANGLYQVISNGVPENNWISYLDASARTAVGGIADIGEVVKVTSTVIKNYGLEWSAAQDIQDKIQLTAKNGVTSFEQLAQALPSVTGQAAQLGVSFTEMLAVMSTLTGVTGNTSEVATQLASVLTALTKESSRSQKMAEEMGISFNASSIKAAGGLRNYLQELDRTVSAYAEKTGQLKESIYSKLFGRAEALRLVNGLTGEMAGKFNENINALDNSVGTIDDAFRTMSSGVNAKIKLIGNSFAGLKDILANIFNRISPFLDIVSEIGMIALSAEALRKSFVYLSSSITQFTAKTGLSRTVISLWNATAIRVNAIVQLVSASFKGAAVSARTLKLAVQGLMMVGGVTAAWVLLNEALSLFSKKSEKANAASEALSDAEEAYKSKLAESKIAIGDEIAKLEQLILAKSDTKEAVKSLNDRYGELLGTYSTGSQWLKVLKDRSDEYCQQLAIEAKADTIRRKIYEKNAELMIIAEKKRRLESSGEAMRKMTVSNDGDTATINVMSSEYRDLVGEEKELKDVVSVLENEFDIVNSAALDNSKRLKDVREGNERVTDSVDESTMSYKELGDAITKQKEKLLDLIGVEGKEQEAQDALSKLNNMQSRYKALGDQYGLNQSNHKTPKIKEEKLSLIENAKTYKDLANNVSYYQQELEKANITDKDNILSLARKKAEAEKLVEEFKKLTDVSEKAAEYKPEDISKLSTVGDIDKAISFYTDEQKKADANRIQELQIMINDLTAKKNILQIGTELPDMQKQMEEISGLTGKELTMRITGLGFDELTAKVKELNALLSNTENPLTDEQREQVVRMRDQYAQWANSVQQTTDKMKALEGVSNVAGSVDTLANSLKGLAGESKEMAAAMAGVSLAATIAQMVAGMVKKANETTLTIWDWIAGIAAGTAAVISAASQLKGISAFANGGIVSGPTMALVGEYAGASNNPEVIAPLDKLRSMIKAPDDNGGRVTFHIEGRTLVGVLNKENNMRGRS